MPSTPADHPKAAETTAASATTLSDVHPDIIQTHILTRLAGPAIASAATTCSQLHTLASHEPLWKKTCHATWPSTLAPRVRDVIDTFPEGHRSFFADSFPSPCVSKILPRNPHSRELISAVDLFHGERLILSKVVETETATEWFRCSPFRIDVVDPKDAVRAGVTYPVDEATCRELEEKLRLTWVVIDPAARRAVDVSSGTAVAVEKHWLSGEVVVRFSTAAGEEALCGVAVTWGTEMQVREVSLQMEDLDGMQMNGRESLVILQGALRGTRKKKKEGGEGFREFLKRKKERKEGKVRAEGRLDMVCVGLVVLAIVSSSLLVFWRWHH
ncbi:unnamed protein product [Sphenostylis stenocarpa]|uniref:F-box protein n=1 Tax=Sphenostylis stenocarpa TaxID=92480 RepID=A0AA86SNT5_9FABA|nr:unnamed protein product [Sphenostylis stenocarpa]